MSEIDRHLGVVHFHRWEPHRVRPNRAKTKCLDCGREIRKGPRRPSGLYWRHVVQPKESGS